MNNTAKKQETNTVWDDFVVANAAPDWANTIRQQGYAQFAEKGLPTTRVERYKYTNLPAAEAGRYFPQVQSPVTLAGETAFAQEVSLNDLPDWAQTLVSAAPAGEAQYKDMVLWQAANAYLRDCIVLDVPKNTNGKAPLQLTITGNGFNSFVPRLLVRVQENAEFTIIERHNGNGSFWNNAVTQVVVEKGGKLRHYRIQENGDEAIYTQNTHISIARDASYEAFALTTGSMLSRNQIHADLQGENGEVRLDGINLLSGAQHADTTITIEHQAPHCRSDQNYKSILDDKSHGVFQGKVHVHQIAQKTDGYQLANTLLLSSNATMDTKPELEIYADDVKCSHGSTTGQIDTGPLFYLRSRGLSEAQARLLLMQAFLGPALEQITDENAREMFGEMTLNWLTKQAKK